MAKYKVLIIEDEEYIAQMYKIRFEQGGFDVVWTNNGTDGYEAAKKEKPNLILLDLVMPGIDGYETLSKLKIDQLTRICPVYVLSNLGQQDEIDRAMQGGADGFLIKAQLTPTQLFEKIKGLCQSC